MMCNDHRGLLSQPLLFAPRYTTLPDVCDDVTPPTLVLVRLAKGKHVLVVRPELEVAGILPDTAWVSISLEVVPMGNKDDTDGIDRKEESTGDEEDLSPSGFTWLAYACCCNCCNWRSCK